MKKIFLVSSTAQSALAKEMPGMVSRWGVYEYVGSRAACSVEDALKIARTRRTHPINGADVVIVEHSEKNLSLGLRIVRMCRALSHRPKIMLVNMPENSKFFGVALDTGVVGFVGNQDRSPGEMRIVLERMVEYGTAISKDLLTLLLGEFRASLRSKASPLVIEELKVHLTEEEMEVLLMLVKGYPIPRIAKTIPNVNRNWVDTRARNIYKKLGVHNRPSLAIYAKKHGLV